MPAELSECCELAPGAIIAISPEAPTNEQIRAYEAHALTLPQTNLRTRHYKVAGLIAREIVLEPGTWITGAAHKHEHLAVCVGDITVSTDAGVVRMSGHHTLPCKPGQKRIGYSHGWTVWTTFHPCNAETIAEFEDWATDEADMLQTRRVLEAA